MLKSHRLAALAAVLVVGAVTPANAVQVTYSTSGTFGFNGTNPSPRAAPRSGTTPITTTVDAAPTTYAHFGSFTYRRGPAEPRRHRWSTRSP